MRRIPLSGYLSRLAIVSLGVWPINNAAVAEDTPRYLAFQVHSTTIDAKAMRLIVQLPPQSVGGVVSNLRNRIGVSGTGNRHLGFILGPIAFDNTDEQVRELIKSGFETALNVGVAVGFHIDDSVFWGRLKELNKPENIEWLDWKGPPTRGRRLNWDPPNPMKFTPQLCFNSQGVKSAVKARAALIGKEIAKGVQELHKAGKDDLFIGVIAGWETDIGRDFDTGKTLGYCALINAGFSENHPPADMDDARSKIVKEFIEFWASAAAYPAVPGGARCGICRRS
jgi:hypothetical protein